MMKIFANPAGRSVTSDSAIKPTADGGFKIDGFRGTFDTLSAAKSGRRALAKANASRNTRGGAAPSGRTRG